MAKSGVAYTRAVREAILELPTLGHSMMTVRGVFYVLATNGIVPKTHDGYRKVQDQTLKLRREGELDFAFIVDGSRSRLQEETFTSVGEALLSAADSYHRDLWSTQGKRVEVWLEKDALSGLIWPVVSELRASLMVSRGQPSETFVYDAASVARNSADETVILALYDSDSFGRDAAEKVRTKLSRYAPGVTFSYELVAVTDEQIAEYDLPTRPDKKDARDVVELDAFQVAAPGTLEGILKAAIQQHIDTKAWKREQKLEAAEREAIIQHAEAYE